MKNKKYLGFIKKINNQKGIGLVETLIAISLAVVVVTSLISLAVYALRNSRQASYTAQATQIAQNQLELLRAYRDSHTWAQFTGLSCTATVSATCATAPTGGCSYPLGGTPDPSSAPTAGAKTDVSPFTYTSFITNTSGTYRAGVAVFWSVGGKNQCIYNYTDFTNWRGR